MSDIRIEHLVFKFSKQQASFFQDVSFSCKQGNIYFFQGKNGSGKSTLFRILSGNGDKDEVISGMLSLDDANYAISSQENVRKVLAGQVKLVHQNFDVMIADQFSFIDNLRLANLPVRPTLRSLPEHRPIPDLIKRFGINYDVPVHQLSGGQRQILTILMALQKPAKILLLDEPTAALDVKNAQVFMDFLYAFVKATPSLTVFVICHDHDLVEQYTTTDVFDITVDEKSALRTISQIKMPAKSV